MGTLTMALDFPYVHDVLGARPFHFCRYVDGLSGFWYLVDIPDAMTVEEHNHSPQIHRECN